MSAIVGKPGKGSLWHTKEGDLDFGWLILAACCIVGLLAFVAAGLGVFKAPIAAWSWFGAFTSMAFIAGAAISRARLIAASRMPGEVARGIAESVPDDPRLPNIHADDERADPQ